MVPARRPLVVVAAIKARSGKQVACSKTLIARPAEKETVAKMCADITSYSLEQAKERASGIVVFNCVRDQWDDHVFHFWERYESNASLGRHNTCPRVVQFMEEVSRILARMAQMAPVHSMHGGNLFCAFVFCVIQRRCTHTWSNLWRWHCMSTETGNWGQCACQKVCESIA